jgi:hypothetical protein
MEERNVNTWEEFEDGLKSVRKEYVQSARSLKSPLLFRGQEDSCWLLRTTLERNRERMPFKDYYRIIAHHNLQKITTSRQWVLESGGRTAWKLR